MATDSQNNIRRQGRMAALVIAATGLLWVGGTFAGNSLGWSNRTMALVDMLALAGFVFGLVVTYRIWRQRQTDEG
ncbi:hypothetical protein ALP8811_00945 [Aliiroseovarius pelagivivens]|uniref:DUF5337 domain-containing protein n=1 Tax=Aliiroseovarius pelagivivens TaxID=1639690 RepID=A0A2R8AIV7_9RHOB|nr:DUF5337 domain-containing protein [Aliiroseovarius pelagivivens]SPF75950.1 hypothetical protein ALP8811_00945 [Aliiroseovarius pelagivivens]